MWCSGGVPQAAVPNVPARLRGDRSRIGRSDGRAPGPVLTAAGSAVPPSPGRWRRGHREDGGQAEHGPEVRTPGIAET